jgi:hypothetical protein
MEIVGKCLNTTFFIKCKVRMIKRGKKLLRIKWKFERKCKKIMTLKKQEIKKIDMIRLKLKENNNTKA